MESQTGHEVADQEVAEQVDQVPTLGEQLAADRRVAAAAGVESAMRQEQLDAASPAISSWARRIDLSQLRESRTNPRKRWGDLDELIASIRKSGILMPLIVRPIGEADLLSANEAATFEIVCGARRFRAGKQAGINEFPCDVRMLSNEHVLEFQIIENLQRKDLHPMEEAEGYEALKASGYEVPTIAARMGKSTGWVYSRLQLLKLTPEARAAFFEKKIDLSVAQVLGRQPHANQGRALIGLERLPTVREQIDYLQNEFARNLKGAPFDLKDATLPRLCDSTGLGDCASCPNNSNNAPRELFADYSKIERAGVCSDTPCFAARAEAIVDRMSEKARARGEKVLSAEETKKVISYGTPTHGSPYVNSKDVVSDDPKRRTWEQIVGKLDKDQRPEVVLAPDDQRPGEMFRLYDRKAAVKAAIEAGAKWAQRQAPEEKQVEASKKKRKASDDKARLVAETVDQAMPQLAAKWRKAVALPELRAMFPEAIVNLSAEQLEVLEPAFGWGSNVEKWIDKTATVKDLTALILAGTLFPQWQDGSDALHDDLKVCAKASGLDLAAIGRAQLEARRVVTKIEKWKEVDGGAEATNGLVLFGVSYNGGDYFWSAETKKDGVIASGDCKTLEAGKKKCEQLAAKGVGT